MLQVVNHPHYKKNESQLLKSLLNPTPQISGSTTDRGRALVSSPLDGCPGVAGGHEVGVLPRGGVDGSTRLIQVAVEVSRESVVAVGAGHAVGPADGLHGGEGGGGGHLVAGGELGPGRVPTEAVHRNPVIVVAEQDTLGGVAGSGGGPGIGAVDVAVVVILTRVGNIFLSLGPPGRSTTLRRTTLRTTRGSTTTTSTTRTRGGGRVTQAGVQAGALVGQSQRPVRVGQVVKEGATSHCQPYSSQHGVSDGAALAGVDRELHELPARAPNVRIG